VFFPYESNVEIDFGGVSIEYIPKSVTPLIHPNKIEGGWKPKPTG
jgi:hypothetical protein